MIEAYCLNNCGRKFVQEEGHEIFCEACFRELCYQGKAEENRNRRVAKRRREDHEDA